MVHFGQLSLFARGLGSLEKPKFGNITGRAEVKFRLMNS